MPETSNRDNNREVTPSTRTITTRTYTSTRTNATNETISLPSFNASDFEFDSKGEY